MHYARFHLNINRRGQTIRTTASIDAFLFDLLAVSLGQAPRTREAHTAVRQWLDKSLSEWMAFDPELPVSRQAGYLALRRVADPALIQAMEPDN